MAIDPLLDTVMNITVFLFIGLMLWLYFRKERRNGDGPGESR